MDTEGNVPGEQRLGREMGPEQEAGADDYRTAWASQGQWESPEGSEHKSDTLSGYFEQLSGHHVKKQRMQTGSKETSQETIAGVQVRKVDSLDHGDYRGQERKKQVSEISGS